MKGLILSGGRGSRLQPFSHTRPKQLIPVANRPVLCYIFDALRQVGISDVGIVVGETGELIRRKLENELFPGFPFTFITQEVPLGLAHAVKTAQPFLGRDDFLMVLGDNLFEESLEKAVRLFYAEQADALISLIPVEEPRRFGIAEVVGGRIVSLAEKPAVPRSNLAIMGIYIFRETIFPAIERISPSGRGELEITDAIRELIRLGGKVVPYMFSGWWLDTGRPADVLDANRTVLRHLCGRVEKGQSGGGEHASCLVAPSAQIWGSILQGPLIIGEGCRVVNSFIGPFTSLGDGSIVENSAVENSILLEKAVIKGVRGAIVNSIIGEEAEIMGEEAEAAGAGRPGRPKGGGYERKTFLLGADSRVYINI